MCPGAPDTRSPWFVQSAVSFGVVRILPFMPRDRAKFTKVRPVDPEAPEALWRLFVGFDFPEGHRTRLDKLLGIVHATDLPIRWIAANTAHMTLHFNGEIPGETAELLRLA